jgi:transcriptional regulator with XRE-family HTH domain
VRPRDLATRTKCSVGHLRNIETGSDQPSDLLAHAIARELGIEVDDFSDSLMDEDEQRGAA